MLTARKAESKEVILGEGEYQYRIDQVLNDMIERCKALNLRLASPEERTKFDFMVLLTVQTMNYLHGGRHRIAL